ncbi:T9SS type A sorting domain-containing protein [Flavobacterium psychrotrophum]|uniref:T9SS type A sorting domain-containing protein n=1 Tax=Flavobacterium psychrotrophum TaxID=2294119 RepID=UPI000E3151CE|nr:DUF5074 domain-containing protein [Flavobacterium psychrotrophum]
MKKNYFSKKICFLVLYLTAIVPAFAQSFTDGIFVLNEGGAGSGNASVSFLANNAEQPVNNIYATVNPTQGALGDTAQSLSFNGNYAYIVLNISNTVKVVNRTTFEYVATISTGLVNPRYMAFYDGKGYVTNWGNGGSAADGYIAVIDLQTNTVESTITVAPGVERILTVNDKLYAAHQGGFGYGTTLSVIDPVSNTVSSTVTVGDVPNKMIVDGDFMYVLCGGRPSWGAPETDGSLVKINLADNTVVATTNYEGLHPANLEIDTTGNFYFTSAADIYKAAFTTPETITEIASLEPQGAYGVYGMNLIDDTLYVADAGNYVSPGTAYLFSTTGTPQGNYTVGVIPNSFYKADSSLSIPVQQGNQLAVYPNPASGQFFVTTDAAAEVAVYDLTGKEVLKAKYAATGVNIANLSQGMYMVKISDGKQTTMKKLIVK